MTLDEVGKECIIVSTTAPKVWRDRTKEEEGNLVTGPTEISPTRQACTTLVLKGDQGSPSLVLPPVLSRRSCDTYNFPIRKCTKLGCLGTHGIL